jgi:hypothetical protein
MSRRIDIELTSLLPDGTWTWRAAGEKAPKGIVGVGILPTEATNGSIWKVEADFDLDGITVLSVVPTKERGQRANVLALLPSDASFQPVTQKLSPKGDRAPGRRTGRKDGDTADRRRDPRTPRTSTDGTSSRTDSANRRPRFVAPPDLPKRPTAKRLKPKRVHRAAVLETLPEEQRGVAEKALVGGIKAVRDAVQQQNEQLKKESKPLIPADGLIAMAQDLLPKLRVADWLDRAEAAKADLEQLDLRDLRSVVVAADDPMVVRDESTRALASELKDALKRKQNEQQELWLSDIRAAIAVGRVVRALKLSSEPPKAGQPFPVDLGVELTALASSALVPQDPQDRWTAVLEAVAFSPVRSAVKAQGIPEQPSAELLATVKRLAPLIPQIAALFGIVADPGSSAPRPLRPVREKRGPNRAVKSATRTSPNGSASPVNPAAI